MSVHGISNSCKQCNNIHVDLVNRFDLLQYKKSDECDKSVLNIKYRGIIIRTWKIYV